MALAESSPQVQEQHFSVVLLEMFAIRSHFLRNQVVAEVDHHFSRMCQSDLFHSNRPGAKSHSDYHFHLSEFVDVNQAH